MIEARSMKHKFPIKLEEVLYIGHPTHRWEDGFNIQKSSCSTLGDDN